MAQVGGAEEVGGHRKQARTRVDGDSGLHGEQEPHQKGLQRAAELHLKEEDSLQGGLAGKYLPKSEAAVVLLLRVEGSIAD